jgi:hypothetical protein
MKARMIVVNPQNAGEPPTVPQIVADNEGVIVLSGDGWAFPLPYRRLEDVTEEDIHVLIGKANGGNMEIYLSSPRTVPAGHPLSESLLNWLQDWWRDAVAEWAARRPVAKAS